MNSAQATVSKILTYSVVDGPGNRLVIFLQGCNFHCTACHNPHTIGQCTHCGDCVPACHAKALSINNGRISFDPTACDQCDDCLSACPINANPMVQTYSVEQILEIIREHRPFLTGITLSGGEATLQFDFIKALFKAIKEDPELCHLSCFIDSNGHLSPEKWHELLEVTDGVMLDIKAFDGSLHRHLTGRNNLKSQRSAQVLLAAGKLYELRYLLIPGMTDRDEELDHLISFVTSLGKDVRLKLNAFQHHGVKGAGLEMEEMSKTGVEAAAERLRAAGIADVITPQIYL
jgi:pyruvate formate lyase activating enzyme